MYMYLYMKYNIYSTQFKLCLWKKIKLFSTCEVRAGFTEKVEYKLGRISVGLFDSYCRIKSGISLVF